MSGGVQEAMKNEVISESEMQVTARRKREKKGRVARQLQTKITLETAKQFYGSLIRD